MKFHADTKSPHLTIALCGNPNSGKTTLFNLLTGANQKVGNWPGVTVERKTGLYKKDCGVHIVDTPGIYSLSPFAEDEQVTFGYLTKNNPDIIVNVVDATNLQRSLFLTTQLAQLNIPLVVALNMQDEAKKRGIAVDSEVLEKSFGCKCFAISASKNMGIAELMRYCTTIQPKKECSAPTAQAQTTNDLSPNSATPSKTPKEGLLAAQKRYAFVDDVLKRAQSSQRAPNNAETTSQKTDKYVLNKWLAFPIFAAVMLIVFFVSVDGLGGWMTGLISTRLTPWLQLTVSGWFSHTEADWLRSLVVDGIIGGVMSVVGFLPQIVLLFGFIAILEASGYMSRIAFITDRLLNKIGLGGRSFVSMILGCGCSVPAIMATRTIKNAKERNSTVTLTPFMPCSAKLAVISFFTAYVFHGNALFAVSFYFLSIFAVIAGGLVLKLLHGHTDASDAFIMELPQYRAPTLRNVTKQMWERGKAFLAKAGTIIFAASVILWLLTNFDIHLQMTEVENSILATLGKIIAPLFYPLGWNDRGCGWQFAIATFSGIAAKETVVTTLEILLPQGVHNGISVLGAYSFVAYNLLTVPCAAAISASFAEQGHKSAVFSVLFQIALAYTVSLLIYRMGTLAQMHTSAFIIIAVCSALALAIFFAAKHSKKGCCPNCSVCHVKQNCNTHK